MLAAASVFGQGLTGNPTDVRVKKQAKKVLVYPEKGYEGDTLIRVTYADKKARDNDPAYFLNGKLISQSLFNSMSVTTIESVSVVKKDTVVNGKVYDGQIKVESKSDYTPNVVSLAFIKENVVKLKDGPSIFMIDDHLVKEDYEECLLDKNYILSITVHKLKNEKEGLDVNVVKILTKTKENIEKVNQIRIRGVQNMNELESEI